MQRKQSKAEIKKRKKRASRVNLTYVVVVGILLFALGFYLGYEKGVGAKRRDLNILLVNESHPLPADFEPEDLVNLYRMRHSFRLARSDIYLTNRCYQAAQEMFAAAEAADMNGYIITSGYRSYEKQREVYAESEPGYAQAPGCSEHQTGLCFDVTVESNDFESTPQYSWLSANAHKYGFIQRYPAGKSGITGISYEPWHYRYVGIDAAAEIYRKNLTLEEYLGKV